MTSVLPIGADLTVTYTYICLQKKRTYLPVAPRPRAVLAPPQQGSGPAPAVNWTRICRRRTRALRPGLAIETGYRPRHLRSSDLSLGRCTTGNNTTRPDARPTSSIYVPTPPLLLRQRLYCSKKGTQSPLLRKFSPDLRILVSTARHADTHQSQLALATASSFSCQHYLLYYTECLHHSAPGSPGPPMHGFPWPGSTGPAPARRPPHRPAPTRPDHFMSRPRLGQPATALAPLTTLPRPSPGRLRLHPTRMPFGPVSPRHVPHARGPPGAL